MSIVSFTRQNSLVLFNKFDNCWEPNLHLCISKLFFASLGQMQLKLNLHRLAEVLASAIQYLVGSAWLLVSFSSNNLMMFSSISTGKEKPWKPLVPNCGWVGVKSPELGQCFWFTFTTLYFPESLIPKSLGWVRPTEFPNCGCIQYHFDNTWFWKEKKKLLNFFLSPRNLFSRTTQSLFNINFAASKATTTMTMCSILTTVRLRQRSAIIR